MDPVNLADLGEWIAHQLIEVQPDQAAYFEKRAKDFRTRMMKLDGEIAEMLKPYSGRAFFIYHPALSYFAGRYGLHQEAIEESGHAPSIGELHRLIKRARDEGIRTIFVQPQESLRHAEVVSQAIGGSIEEIDPMALDLEANLLKISQVLVESFSPQ